MRVCSEDDDSDATPAWQRGLLWETEADRVGGAILTIQSWGVTPTEAHYSSLPPSLNPIDILLEAPGHFAVGSFLSKTFVFRKWIEGHLLMNDSMCTGGPGLGLAGGFLDQRPGKDPPCRGECASSQILA